MVGGYLKSSISYLTYRISCGSLSSFMAVTLSKLAAVINYYHQLSALDVMAACTYNLLQPYTIYNLLLMILKPCLVFQLCFS